jgi:hypothetical protein
VTYRVHALTVLLHDDIRDDDAQPLIDAIKMLKGVTDVQPHVSDFSAVWAMAEAKRQIRAELGETFYRLVVNRPEET